MIKPGLRVVRGPNWSWGNQDGGEGYVGTVSKIGTDESDKTVVVQWDNGSQSFCSIGYSDKYDLRVIDNAQVGVVHPRVSCDSCNTRKISGLRYKCLRCYDYDLCYMCYHRGKHDLTHSFRRFNTQESFGINLQPRLNARKCHLKGIFVGATVMRGADWEWGNQDGGEGNCGIVLDIRDLRTKRSRSTERSAVNVKWYKTNTEIYRVGHNGLSDIQFVEAASGGEYYPEHLPILGQTEEQMEFNQIVESIELQQVMEMESAQQNASAPKMEENNNTEQTNSTSIQSRSAKSVFSVIKLYITNILNQEEGSNLMDEFFKLSRDSRDEMVKEMWEILKHITESPLYRFVCCDIVEKRNTPFFIWESVELGKNLLQKRFIDYMTSVLIEDNPQSVLAHTTTYDLVYDFVGLQFKKEYLGLANEMIDDRPLWPMVYYCLRAGCFPAAVHCLTKANIREYRGIISLLQFYVEAPKSRQIDVLEKAVNFSYHNTIINVNDPFKRIVFAVLGCVDDISEVAKTVDDFLWFRLSLIRGDRNVEYKNLQCQILEEEGEIRCNAFKQPLVYFKLLALTGQFEAAIDFLFRTDRFRAEAVHMAIALYELNVLACPSHTDLPLLSIDPEDMKPARRLNFTLLINSFVNKFEADAGRQLETLYYLYFLRKIKNCEKGSNLFEASVADLIIRTKNYNRILGRVGPNGDRQGDLLHEFHINSHIFTENLAQGLISTDQFDEAFALYKDVNDLNGMLTLMCTMLARVAHLENNPGSLRSDFQEKAIALDKRFSKDGFCSAHINIINSFIKLKGLLPFFDLYRARQYPEALKALNELKLVALRHEEIEERVKNFETFVEDVTNVMPHVLLAVMTILGAQCDKIKRTEGPMDKHLFCVWEQANAVTNFAERLLEIVVPRDTWSTMMQMEISMHT